MTVTVAPIAFITLGRRAADLSETATCFISNPLHGQAHGITRIRRHRWHVEVSHEEGPVNGLEQDHVRDFEVIARHVPWLLSPPASGEQPYTSTPSLPNFSGSKTALEGSAGSLPVRSKARSSHPLALAWGTCCHRIISIAHHNSSLRPHIRGWLVVKWEFDMLRSSAGVPFVVP
jgi:hypothetical protein